MEGGAAFRVVALATKPYEPFKYKTRQLAKSLTVCARGIATVVIVETGGDGEGKAIEGDPFNRRVGGSSLKSSRWNETDIGCGKTASTRRVTQSRFDHSATIAVKTATSYRGRDLRKHETDTQRYLTGLKVPVRHEKGGQRPFPL